MNTGTKKQLALRGARRGWGRRVLRNAQWTCVAYSNLDVEQGRDLRLLVLQQRNQQICACKVKFVSGLFLWQCPHENCNRNLCLFSCQCSEVARRATPNRPADPHRLRRDVIVPCWALSDHVKYFNAGQCNSEGGMIRLETLIELKFINSSFSSLSSYWN